MKRIAMVAAFAVLALVAILLVNRAEPDNAVDAAPAHAAATGQSDAQQVAAARRKITDDPVAPKAAPKHYDVTIVEYFDYQCPFCRRLHPVLQQFARTDGHVRIVYRDWPIFGDASVKAAHAAIAAQWQGKHAAFHDALMRSSGKLDGDAIRAAANKAGVDWARLQHDLKAHGKEIDRLLADSSRQAAMMGLRGTPGLLIGPYLVPGGMDYAGLGKAVAVARKYPEGNAPSGD